MTDRERGYYENWCTVCGTTNNSSTVHAGTVYDGGEHCGKPMRCTRWVPVVADPSPPLRPIRNDTTER